MRALAIFELAQEVRGNLPASIRQARCQTVPSESFETPNVLPRAPAAEAQYRYPDMNRALAMVAAVCAVPSVAAAALAMFAAWEHNPQGEFHEVAADGNLVVHWEWWAWVGLSWFLVVFVPLYLFGGGVTALSLRHRDQKSAG
jgi:hypothetical protein